MIFSLKTDWPVAVDSPDYTNPWGVYRDCSVSENFFKDIEKHFQRSISFLDIGTAGGGLPNQAIERGHIGCGLEGSNYWIIENRLDGDSHQAKIWKQHFNKNIFTCDISRNFELSDYHDPEHKIFQFDIISSFEVLEHIHPDRLSTLMQNIQKHLKQDGYFVGSVSMNNDASPGVELHQSIFTLQTWYDMFVNNGFKVEENNKFNRVREENNSFHILLQKEK